MTEEMAEKIKALAKRLEALEKEFEATKEYIQTHDHGTPAMPYQPLRVPAPSEPVPHTNLQYGYK